jgi:hypothetical protein
LDVWGIGYRVFGVWTIEYRQLHLHPIAIPKRRIPNTPIPNF